MASVAFVLTQRVTDRSRSWFEGEISFSVLERGQREIPAVGFQHDDGDRIDSILYVASGEEEKLLERALDRPHVLVALARGRIGQSSWADHSATRILSDFMTRFLSIILWQRDVWKMSRSVLDVLRAEEVREPRGYYYRHVSWHYKEAYKECRSLVRMARGEHLRGILGPDPYKILQGMLDKMIDGFEKYGREPIFGH